MELNDKLIVRIESPERIFFDGEVMAISSFNENGPFDILPMHVNFISLIKNNIVIHHLDKSTREIKIDTAIVRVFRNHVNIFLGIETLKDN